MKCSFFILLFCIGAVSLLVDVERSRADVDPATGSFTSVKVDLLEPVGSLNLDVRRFYRSSSPIIGVFGRGWCSILDEKLTIHKTDARFRFCGDGTETLFPLQAPSQKPGQASAEQIAHGSRKSILISMHHQFYLNLGDGQRRVFNRDGELIKLIGVSGDWIEFHRTNTTAEIRTSTLKNFRLQFGGEGRLTKITSGTQAISYAYAGPLLTSVKFENGSVAPSTESYAYDRDGRLAAVVSSGTPLKTERVHYAKSGFVTSVAHDGCEENLNYQADGLALRTTVALSCGGKITAERSYISKFSRDRKSLISQTQIEGKRRREVELDPHWNLPLRIAETGDSSSEGRGPTSVAEKSRPSVPATKISEFKYDESGRLVMKNAGGIQRFFSYSPNGLVDRFQLKDGPLDRDLKYTYDQRGTLTSVNDNGHIWTLRYGNQGELKEIDNHRGKLLVFTKNQLVPRLIESTASQTSTRAKISHATEDIAQAAQFQLQFMQLLEPIQNLENLERGVF
jgi:YD repeat-containing protein